MNETAQQAYERHLHTMHRHVEDVQALYSHLQQQTAPDWGHVGDVANYNDRLAEIIDRFMKRGEFAR